MEIRLMEYVLEVYRKQSFTKAAASLCIAQPSLSQQIAKLERHLGVTLFYRGHGSVTPTPDGIRFVEQAEQLVKMHDDLEREMLERSEGMGHELNIGTTAITGGHVLPPLLQAFRAQYPNVQIRLVEESTENLTDLTVKGLVDIAILALPVADTRLATQPMFTEPLLLALPREIQTWMTEKIRQTVIQAYPNASPHQQTEAPDLPLSDLSTAPFIVLKQGFGFRHTVMELCAESGFQPNIAFETSSIETAQALVSYGLGITLVPEMVIHHHMPVAPLYASLTSAPTRTLVFAYRRERYLSLAARALLQVQQDMRTPSDTA
ncbi:LysR family transcriptional regulator [Alicyclobacillus fodiniaquatilis]|uniref:LysR family transcriptional regulator n=1 Tax=Alicyclobacillus fodiniaquatilis TaxID=1661150 RepID=A0ABW4JL19_9BACL